jgi:hypothetical protein
MVLLSLSKLHLRLEPIVLKLEINIPVEVLDVLQVHVLPVTLWEAAVGLIVLEVTLYKCKW